MQENKALCQNIKKVSCLKGYKLATAIAIIGKKPSHLTGKQYAESLHGQITRDSKRNVIVHRDERPLFTISPTNVENELEHLKLPCMINKDLNNYCTFLKTYLKKKTFKYECSMDNFGKDVSFEGKNKEDLKIKAKKILENVNFLVSFMQEYIVKSVVFFSPTVMVEASDSLVACLRELESYTLCTKTPAKYHERALDTAIKQCTDFANDVLKKLMQSSLCQKGFQKLAFCILRKLCECSCLFIIIIKQLLNCIYDVTTDLRKVINGSNETLECTMLYNSGVIFQLLETVFEEFLSTKRETALDASNVSMTRNQLSKPHSKSFSPKCCSRPVQLSSQIFLECPNGHFERIKRQFLISVTFLNTIEQQMKDSLLLVSTEFPLFSVYVWKLCHIVAMLVNQLGEKQ